MKDVAAWLPDLLKDHWDQAVESLRAGGEDIVAARTEIWPAHDRRSGGDIRGQVRCKVYEVGDQEHNRVTHGDRDKNVRQTFSVDLQAKDGGDQARRKVHECAQVILRVLELYRRNPHPDWNEVADIRVATLDNFPDFQHRQVFLTLYRYGQVLPTRLLQAQD